MCGKLKTISVEVRAGNGTTRYTYQTDAWPPDKPDDTSDLCEQMLDSLPEHTLHGIMRGSIPLTEMNFERRMAWKLIFDNIEKEFID